MTNDEQRAAEHELERMELSRQQTQTQREMAEYFQANVPTLRDTFASSALNGLLASDRAGEPCLWYDPPAYKGKRGVSDEYAWVAQGSAELWATAAYRLADAMLKARKSEPLK